MFISVILKYLGGTFLGKLGEPFLKFFLFAIPAGLIAFGAYKVVNNYTTLESRNATLAASVARITEDLKVAQEQNKQYKESSKVDTSVVHKNITETVKEDKKLDTNIKNKDKKIEEVKIKFSKELSSRVDNKEPTVEDKVKLEESISTIQINSLWDAYCDGNKDKVDCKAQVS